MGQVLPYTTNLETVDCYSCGITFGIDSKKISRLRDNGQDFWCTNGHKQSFVDSEVVRLRKQLNREISEHDQTRTHVKKEIKSRILAQRQLTTQKAATTRLKNRIHKGVCPCCNRSFQNLRRHMNTKHPNYSEGSTVEAKKRKKRSY